MQQKVNRIVLGMHGCDLFPFIQICLSAVLDF